MAWLDKIHKPERYAKTFFVWGFFGIIMGGLGGLIGAGFHYALHSVTQLREQYNWLIFLLPLGGLLTVAIYRLLGLRSNRGTNEIIDAVLDNNEVKPAIAPAVFLSTGITHLLGGSAGREGAALQMGGSVASLLGKFFHLRVYDKKILVMCGMSAVFAGLFGMPLTATLFCMEFESVGTLFSPALLPCFLAAFTAASVSGALGVQAETAKIALVSLSWDCLWRFAVLAVLVAMLGIAMCFFFHKAEDLAHRGVKNPWLRIVAGGLLVMGLTLLVGDQRYNGAGMDMALSAVAGKADWYDFALKMLFTAITLAAGFKGGEIVPTFCIGATFGCIAGSLLGLEPGVAAAMSLVGLFCCATNSPFASIVLSVEMFGSQNISLFALVCVICFVLSGNSGLYSSQIIQFHKATEIMDAREPAVK